MADFITSLTNLIPKTNTTQKAKQNNAKKSNRKPQKREHSHPEKSDKGKVKEEQKVKKPKMDIEKIIKRRVEMEKQKSADLEKKREEIRKIKRAKLNKSSWDKSVEKDGEDDDVEWNSLEIDGIEAETKNTPHEQESNGKHDSSSEESSDESSDEEVDEEDERRAMLREKLHKKLESMKAERTVKVGSRRFKSNQVYEKKFGVQTEKERQKARREKKMSNRKKKYLEQQEEAKANKEGETNKVNDVKKEETSDLEPNVIEIKTEDELKNENESDVEIKSEDESSDEEMNSNDDSEGENVSDSDVEGESEGESESDSMASPSPAKGASKVKGGSYLKYGEIDASNIVYSNVNTSLEDSYDNCKKLVRGKNYKSMLHKIESRKMKVEKLRAVNPKMAANLEKDDRWDKAMKRAQGFKIMDNVVKLKRLQHKKDAKKRSSKLKWEQRTRVVEEKMEAKQNKRKMNIQNRRKSKVGKRIKGAVKKGRLVM